MSWFKKCWWDSCRAIVIVIGVLIVSFVMLLSGEYVGILFGSILPSFIVPFIAGVVLIVIGIVDMPDVSD